MKSINGMLMYILSRLIQLIPVIIGVTFLLFFIMNLAPGDPAASVAGAEATIEDIERIREGLGLNKNIFVRYFEYMRNMVLHGDLGASYYSGKDVAVCFAERFPSTFKLATAFMVIALALSLPLGIIAAVKQYSWFDTIASFLAIIMNSLPNFWLAILLILLFSAKLGWLPSGGSEHWYCIILPAIAGGGQRMALLTRMTRSSMLEVIRQDYVNTARAKGLSENKVIVKHAFRNALIPVLTSAGQLFVSVMGGTVVMETIFSWPGIGKMLVDSISNRDLPIIIGFVTMTTIVVTIVNLGIDLLYAVVDPRIRSQYESRSKKVR